MLPPNLKKYDMTNSIEQVILRLRNRYEVRKLVVEVKRGYRIGVGKIIEVYSAPDITSDLEASITQDAKPYLVWFRKKSQPEDGLFR